MKARRRPRRFWRISTLLRRTSAADQWAKLRPEVELMAHRNLGFIAMQRKNWDAAEAEFQKALMMNPNNAQVDYWMGTVIASEKKVDKMPAAMFYFARAATYTAKARCRRTAQKTALTYVQKQYKNFHGSDEGFNDLVAAAKANPTPPAGFTIKNANEIAQAQAANEEEYNKTHPCRSAVGEPQDGADGPDGANVFQHEHEGHRNPDAAEGTSDQAGAGGKAQDDSAGDGRQDQQHHHRGRDVEVRDAAAGQSGRGHGADV